MKTRVADYIVRLLSEHGINTVFSVVGGGAMHLNNAFGISTTMKCVYNHHEQASAIAAEGYARIAKKPAIVCVTTGPGGTNALTGVLCAWLDSIPMIIISGQTRYSTTVESAGLDLRQFGEQEYYIVRSVKPMTKYAVMVKDPSEIKYHLERAIFESTNGRGGPCWLDIPLDVQSALVDESDLKSYAPTPSPSFAVEQCEDILKSIQASQRPVLVVGSAVRQIGCVEKVRTLSMNLNIPVLCPTSTVDVFEKSFPLYYGNFGVFGGRAGNFIIQNADLLVCLGSRMSFKQIGFDFTAFSPQSKKIIIDVDKNELCKRTMDIDMPIHADLRDVISVMHDYVNDKFPTKKKWMLYCDELKNKFDESFENYQRKSKGVNPYFFVNSLMVHMPKDATIVVGNSCACVALLQKGILKKGQRIIGNVNCGTMGYDLPAAIGVSIARSAPVICLTGDGSFQMNLQELQTIVHNKLPVKIIVFNNFGYQAIVQTQKNFFGGPLLGCTPESGVSMPDLKKIARAYDIPYFKVDGYNLLEKSISWLSKQHSYAICEVIQDTAQTIQPRLKSKKTPQGQLISPPIDDLFPFLDRKEYLRYAKYKN